MKGGVVHLIWVEHIVTGCWLLGLLATSGGRGWLHRHRRLLSCAWLWDWCCGGCIRRCGATCAARRCR